MTTGAATSSVEIAAACRGITGCQILPVNGTAASAKPFELSLLVMEESDNGSAIRGVQVEGGHPLVGTTCAKKWANLVSPQILGDKI
jgi:hypothetical protein